MAIGPVLAGGIPSPHKAGKKPAKPPMGPAGEKWASHGYGKWWFNGGLMMVYGFYGISSDLASGDVKIGIERGHV